MAWSRHGRVGLLLFSKESNELLTVSVVVVSKDRKNKPNRKEKNSKTVPFTVVTLDLNDVGWASQDGGVMLFLSVGWCVHNSVIKNQT